MVKVTVRFDDDVYERLQVVAEQERRSVNNAVMVLLAEALDARDAEHKK